MRLLAHALGQLVEFIQQRVHHVYRRQRTTPLRVATATNRSSESMVSMSRMRGA
jgi:hypothetical protein